MFKDCVSEEPARHPPLPHPAGEAKRAGRFSKAQLASPPLQGHLLPCVCLCAGVWTDVSLWVVPFFLLVGGVCDFTLCFFYTFVATYMECLSPLTRQTEVCVCECVYVGSHTTLEAGI